MWYQFFPKKECENPSPPRNLEGGRQNFSGGSAPGPPPLTLSSTAPRRGPSALGARARILPPLEKIDNRPCQMMVNTKLLLGTYLYYICTV